MSNNPSVLAPLFHALFAGLERAHGAYNRINQSREDGKLKGDAVTKREPVTDALWAQHLEGQNGLGIVPVRDDATSVFAAIDNDSFTNSRDSGVVPMPGPRTTLWLFDSIS